MIAPRLTPSRVGELRQNQLLHTFGVGALADLPNLSVVIMGLRHWDHTHSEKIEERRLLAAVRAKLGGQVEALRTPPYVPETRDPSAEWARIGVPVGLFPRWLRCSRTRCNLLAPASAGMFDLLDSPFAPDRTRYVHTCHGQGNRRPVAVPARFLLACERGHLDDFPWLYFAHRGADPGPGHTLTMQERGSTGEVANLFVTCSCEVSRSMAEAIGQAAARHLPACRGYHPHLGVFDECGEPTRTIALGATNTWFAMQLSAFSLPPDRDELRRLVAAHWSGGLEVLARLDEPTARAVLPTMASWPAVVHYGVDAVLAAVADHAENGGDDDTDETDLRTPEWQQFTRDSDADSPDFTTRRAPAPPGTDDWLNRVVLVPRLRQVSALYGFTRIDAPEWQVERTPDARRVRLADGGETWVPCAETRGEGIFLRLSEDRLAAWERRPEVRAREHVLMRAHEQWRTTRRLPPGEWQGARYLLLHTLAHVLIRQFALECGYGASGIGERVYARTGSDPMAGVLLYTAARDSEGTLGGLVSLGRPDRLGPLIEQALDAARLCSSDPLCAEHDPRVHGRLHGAACHVCLFAAETSCERGNHYLDRALLVDTLAGDGAGFFPG